MVYYIVFLSKDLISVLFYVYLHWYTIILWMASRDGKIFVDFRYNILSRDVFVILLRRRHPVVSLVVTCSWYMPYVVKH